MNSAQRMAVEVGIANVQKHIKNLKKLLSETTSDDLEAMICQEISDGEKQLEQLRDGLYPPTQPQPSEV